ncbi:MAG: IS3 family transposase [Saprospiraceae bacterium]
MVAPSARRRVVNYLVATHKLSISKACYLSSLSTSTFYYKPTRDDSVVERELITLRDRHPRRGFDAFYQRLRTAGHIWNRKRVHRVYTKLRMQIRKPLKKRFPTREPKPLVQPAEPMVAWSMDFMADALQNGRKVRVLNIIDDFNRESIWQDVQFSYPAALVIRALEIVNLERGLPQRIRVDNGPEYISKDLAAYCKKREIELDFIEPGKPQQNAYVERFNRTFREDVLDANWLMSLRHAQQLTDEWRDDYNNYHPHGSLGYKSPLAYRKSFHEDSRDQEAVKAKMNSVVPPSALTAS